MKKMILNAIWVIGGLSLAGVCLSACNHELDIEQSYPFSIETMPVQKSIVKGETAEIRCTLKRGGYFADTRYTIRYFQPDGKGTLKMDDGTIFKPNDRYPLNKETFRLYTPLLLLNDKPLMCMWRIISVGCNNSRLALIMRRRRKN